MTGGYQVCDLYECFGVVGVYDTLEGAEKATRDWEEETDGKCDVIIRKWDEALCAYRAIPQKGEACTGNDK